MRRLVGVILIVGILMVMGMADYLHLNASGPETPFISFSGATVLEPIPCCFNAVMFESSAYDNYYWFNFGLGYGMKNESLSIGGGIGFVGEGIGPFFFSTFCNQYVLCQIRGIIGISPCYSCVNSWDFDLFLALHRPCPATLEIQNSNICNRRFGFFDVNVGVCSFPPMLVVVGYDTLVDQTQGYVGLRVENPQFQAVGKLYLDPCRIPCYSPSRPSLGLTINWQF